jgi:methionine-S-sulfoxide reductase
MSLKREKAVLAGGCFWGMQDLIRKRPGVLSTRVGYTGGDVANATYWNHGTHAEAIEIVFDPEVTSYRELLEFFFQIHDPTTRNRQGNDIGVSYRSAIFYLDEEQRRCRGVRALARQGRHRGHPSRSVLGGRAGAPGLPGALPERLHLPLPAPGLGAAPPERRGSLADGLRARSCASTSSRAGWASSAATGSTRPAWSGG